jgi:queuine tRNA-ribosyltransferase
MQQNIYNLDAGSRRGQLIFKRGTVETPAFMPVGTYGTVKAMTPEELRSVGAEMTATCMISCTGMAPS